MLTPRGQLLRVRRMIHVARESHMILMCLLVLLSCGKDTQLGHGHAEIGVLRAHSSNSRWLTHDDRKAIYLTGISGGANPNAAFAGFQDVDFDATPDNFDAPAAFAAEAAAGRNFLRLWVLGQTAWAESAEEFFGNIYWRVPITQMPFCQTSSRSDTSTGVSITVGIYDLTCFNEDYFTRLRTRVLAAVNTSGISAVSVMLQPSVGHLTIIKYSGFSNPFLLANNINNINCDTGEGRAHINGNCEELSTLLSGDNGANILAIQDAYARKVIDTLNDIDPIIWEITNENQNGTSYGTLNSLAWTNHMTDLVHSYEATGGRKAHLVWMSPYPETTSANMFANTHADITSPYCEGASPPVNWDTNPTANDGMSTISIRFIDSDHQGGFGQCGTEVSGWPWKLFTRGYHPIFLDERESADVKTAIKSQMAQTLRYANGMNLQAMVPEAGTTIFSSSYGLSEACSEYLMFQPSAATNSINLTRCEGQSFSVEYLDPETGAVTAGTDVNGGVSRDFTTGAMRVVYLKRRQPM
jgi:hypothetical protein